MPVGTDAGTQLLQRGGQARLRVAIDQAGLAAGAQAAAAAFSQSASPAEKGVQPPEVSLCDLAGCHTVVRLKRRDHLGDKR